MIENTELPLGFAMQLAQNTESMNHFCHLPKGEQKVVVEGAKNITSYNEMKAYVENLSKIQ